MERRIEFEFCNLKHPKLNPSIRNEKHQHFAAMRPGINATKFFTLPSNFSAGYHSEGVTGLVR